MRLKLPLQVEALRGFKGNYNRGEEKKTEEKIKTRTYCTSIHVRLINPLDPAKVKKLSEEFRLRLRLRRRTESVESNEVCRNDDDLAFAVFGFLSVGSTESDKLGKW